MVIKILSYNTLVKETNSYDLHCKIELHESVPSYFVDLLDCSPRFEKFLGSKILNLEAKLAVID